MSTLYRTTEPVGGFCKGKLVIVPAGTPGVKADPWPEENPESFALIVDDFSGPFDGARLPELVDAQVEQYG